MTATRTTGRKFALLALFGIAMGLLEAAVVVYLRKLYYPGGFGFPMAPMALHVLSVEYLREFSTIVMLLCAGALAGRNFPQRLSFFLYGFGVWDIFYYAWLKVFLNWPPSWLTWDILFLIPVVWAGPVLAPVICSVTMICVALLIISLQEKGYQVTIRRREWIIALFGAFLIFITFTADYSMLIFRGGYLPRLLHLAGDPDFQSAVSRYVPEFYNWGLFAAGEIMVLAALFLLGRRIRSGQGSLHS